MGVRVSHLQTNSKPLDVKFPGALIHVNYRPAAISGKRQKELDAMADDSASEAIEGHLIEMLNSWDLEQDDGEPIPITQEGMDLVPTTVKTMIFRAISEDIFPNRRSR